ncbi:MAG: SusE domain-containing protein [Flavobacteriaceae bacterium]
MKLYIKRFSFLLLSLVLFLGACETEETLVITSPDAEFVLEQPGISSIFLNYAVPTNAAFTLVWTDEVTGSGTYTVEMATDDAFTNPIQLGTSSTRSFSMNVADFNTAINNSGVSSFVDLAIYMRVNAGGTLSNDVLFLVTTYPTDPAMITTPANGDSFVLDIGNASNVAMNVTWSDAVLQSSLGVSVDYSVEVALAGTSFAATSPIGMTTDMTTLDVTHEDLNGVALGLGVPADTAGDLDMRIVATITNSNNITLTRTSETVTVSVTTYNVNFPFVYLVGDATTPGWNNNNNNTPVFRSQSTPNSYHYTGYFGAGAFKILEAKGQWQPQWGTNDGSTLAVNPGGGSDPGTFNVSAAGYYTYTFSPLSSGATFTVAPYDASGAATYSKIGIIGSATPGGWGAQTDLNQDPNNPHLWYINGVTLTSGNEILIRANDAWSIVWRHNGSSSDLFGDSFIAGSGNNFPFNEATGTYDVWFNDLDGSYVIIPN